MGDAHMTILVRSLLRVGTFTRLYPPAIQRQFYQANRRIASLVTLNHRHSVTFVKLSTVNASSLTNQHQDHHHPDTTLADEIATANHVYQGRVEIVQQPTTHNNDDDDDTDNNYGLVARCQYAQGDLILQSEPKSIHTVPTQHSIQTNWHTHVVMTLPNRFLNHACGSTSNVGLVLNDVGSYDFVALRDISTGQALLWDYEMAEAIMTVPFECHCGGTDCRGTIVGFCQLPNDPTTFSCPTITTTTTTTITPDHPNPQNDDPSGRLVQRQEWILVQHHKAFGRQHVAPYLRRALETTGIPVVPPPTTTK